MARKRHSDEDVLKLLREIELKLAAGDDVASACRSVGISDATYYNWRKRFGGIGRSQLSEMKSLEKENARLKRIVAELELDKLILKESLTGSSTVTILRALVFRCAKARASTPRPERKAPGPDQAGHSASSAPPGDRKLLQ